MPVKFGKPGTRKYRGRIRAQMDKCFDKCQEILDYNTKLSEMTPPITFLTGTQQGQFTAVSNTLLSLLAQLNVG